MFDDREASLQPSRRRPRQTRRGTVLVLLVVCLIPLVACVALAVDLGMLTFAQTQMNDAADSAALARAPDAQWKFDEFQLRGRDAVIGAEREPEHHFGHADYVLTVDAQHRHLYLQHAQSGFRG